MAGFRPGELKKISKDILNNIQDNRQDIINLSTKELQDSIRFYDVYDTGNLRRSSFTKLFVYSKGATIRFITDGEKAPYWPFPRNGWGTSRNIGPRKYDILAGEKTATKLKLKK